MSRILAYIERLPDGSIATGSIAAWGLAHELGDATAVTASSADDASLAEALRMIGVTESDHFERTNAGMLAAEEVEMLARSVEEHGAGIVVLPHSIRSIEIAGRLATRLKAAVATDVIGARLEGDGRVVTVHSVFGGGFTVEARCEAPVAVVTVRSGAVDAPSAQAGPATLVSRGSVAVGTRSTQVVRETSADAGANPRPSLTTAKTVVSGGRGLGTPEGFQALAPLADVLGAALGASRAAVDARFAPSELQVGQTGVTVSPALYVAVGISGAVQHLAGMQTASTVISINTDHVAPIFEVSDFSIVGDAHEVLPALVAEIERRR